MKSKAKIWRAGAERQRLLDSAWKPKYEYVQAISSNYFTWNVN